MSDAIATLLADAIATLLADAFAKRERARALGCYDTTDARDAEPAPDHWYGPWCADYGMRRGAPRDPAYLETLAQLGMSIDEHGQYRVTRPPACGHTANERNIGRDQLTCDGCRRTHGVP